MGRCTEKNWLPFTDYLHWSSNLVGSSDGAQIQILPFWNLSSGERLCRVKNEAGLLRGLESLSVRNALSQGGEGSVCSMMGPRQEPLWPAQRCSFTGVASGVRARREGEDGEKHHTHHHHYHQSLLWKVSKHQYSGFQKPKAYHGKMLG